MSQAKKNKKAPRTAGSPPPSRRPDVPGPGLPSGGVQPPTPVPLAFAAPAFAPPTVAGVPTALARRTGVPPLITAAQPTAVPPAAAAPRQPAQEDRAHDDHHDHEEQPHDEQPHDDEARDDEARDDEVPRWAAKALEELLVVTCWIDPGERPASGAGTGRDEPFSATVRFAGQRTDISGRPGPGDTFIQDEGYKGIVPGSGPVAVTAEVRGINPGTWTVSAKTVPRDGVPGPALAGGGQVPPPRRVSVPAEPSATVATTTMLHSKVPGIIRFAYFPLVVLGVIVGLVLEGLLLGTAHYPLLRPIGFSVAAVAAGVIGGKAWYGAVHRWRKWDGWCIQGFVAGAAFVVAAAALAGPGLPAGAFLAAATPALLIGMGIGRHACFWAGCCTGRPTAWRWGIWSSDRRLGCKRMPVQLYEAWTALAIGGAALGIVAVAGLARTGPVAIMGLAAYTLVRQGILGLRDEPRAWRHGRAVTAALSVLALLAGALLLVI